MLEQAAAEAPPGHNWPFDLEDPPAIMKTGSTHSLTGKRYQQRRSISEEQLRAVLQVPDVSRTRGKRILVFDDFFTDGWTLNEVARALRQKGGASAVCGVTLCRQRWRGGQSTAQGRESGVPF